MAEKIHLELLTVKKVLPKIATKLSEKFISVSLLLKQSVLCSIRNRV